MIKIKSYKAGKGDAFLLSFGENKEHNIMIDMGISATYSQIKPDLELLASNGKKIDLLVVTHMHADHIGGAIKFLKDNGNDKNIIEVDEVWHNSYRHLNFDKKNKSEDIEDRTITVLRNYIERQESMVIEDKIEKSSVRQGSSFSKNLKDYNWNSSFNGEPVVLKDDTPKKIGKNINIILLSPNESKLNALSSEWLTWLNSKRISHTGSAEEFEYAFEFLMQKEDEIKTHIEKASSGSSFNFKELCKKGEDTEDTTVPNGTSIAFIIEYKDKKLLFLGDAHEEIIYENLNKLKEYGYSLVFDLVKVSHHGSIENISNRLLSIIDSKKYLISTNGKGYEHPSIISLAKIIMNKQNTQKEIIFNYPLQIIDDLKPFMKDYNFEIKCLEEFVLC